MQQALVPVRYVPRSVLVSNHVCTYLSHSRFNINAFSHSADPATAFMLRTRDPGDTPAQLRQHSRSRRTRTAVRIALWTSQRPRVQVHASSSSRVPTLVRNVGYRVKIRGGLRRARKLTVTRACMCTRTASAAQLDWDTDSKDRSRRVGDTYLLSGFN
ncbi:hypothetical protein L226DRAFT_259329 [Lentinus tigrinus ALCF2SS1-7]|uniref:uncharacterized protein n=1 Tax=Lentinus tigrinus ALCF2SS1-7 TaxID=1328758 RepID=UPI0011661D1B|nr:hypothetical protein L226DRAFT_259329 [Lentinus tigrinus ALCF2SS1-7]